VLATRKQVDGPGITFAGTAAGAAVPESFPFPPPPPPRRFSRNWSIWIAIVIIAGLIVLAALASYLYEA
jgi:hypothetical protein